MSARAPYHMDASDTIIYVSQEAQTVPGKGNVTPVGIPCVRPQSDMRCYRLDRCDIESGSWQHLTKLNDIATLFTNDERSRYFYILKIFPFSLKGDAKIWFNSLDPGCVRSPQDMIYYFSAKYFPAHKKQVALRDIYIILCNLKKRVSHKLGGGFSNYLMLCLIILSRQMKYLIYFIMDKPMLLETT